VKAAFHAQGCATHAGELVDKPEAGVVPGGFVFRPGIAEADDELDHALRTECGKSDA
jgi:hypothetical protein